MGLCVLADFPSGALVGSDDIVAGVVTRFHGAFGGTAILALEPEDALAWAQTAGEPGDPVQVYVACAAGLVAGAVGGWGRSMGVDLEFAGSSLSEDSVVGILLGTHAPSDTLILSARLVLELAGGPRPVHLYLMVDPKVLEVWAGQSA